jgi:hypothetical protein
VPLEVDREKPELVMGGIWILFGPDQAPKRFAVVSSRSEHYEVDRGHAPDVDTSWSSEHRRFVVSEAEKTHLGALNRVWHIQQAPFP